MAVSKAALERAGNKLFVAAANAYVEYALQGVNFGENCGKTVLLQPHGDGPWSSAQAALEHAHENHRRLPILLTPRDRHDGEPQLFEYAGVLEQIVNPVAELEVVKRSNGLYGAKYKKGKDPGWMLPTADTTIYAKQGLVISGLSRLWPISIPVEDCQNIISPNEGSRCGAVSIPSPKRVSANSLSEALFEVVKLRLFEAEDDGR